MVGVFNDAHLSFCTCNINHFFITVKPFSCYTIESVDSNRDMTKLIHGAIKQTLPIPKPHR